MTVYLLWEENGQSWTHFTRNLKGVYLSRERAEEDIPTWAKESTFHKNFPDKFGSDGIEYKIEEVHPIQ